VFPVWKVLDVILFAEVLFLIYTYMHTYIQCNLRRQAYYVD
jgi:hypothetical protein